MKTGWKTGPLWFGAGLVAFVFFWELFSRFFGSALIFPGPFPVIKKLFEIVPTRRFLSSLSSSFVRVLLGMLISVPLGCLFGIASGLDRRAGALLKPFFSVTAATPVMSVILICFLFLGAEKTPVFTAFLMIFPVMAASSAEGIRRTDPLLKELFRSYKMTRFETLRHLYIPSIFPFILSGLRSSLSLSWKVVIAAEVLVQPLRSLGRGMQDAKVRLETPELFAWTVAAVAAAAFCQGLVSLLLWFRKRRRV